MKLLKKLVPAICMVGATLTVAPTIASCGEDADIKIDQNEKIKKVVILEREKENPTLFKKTSCTVTYKFELKHKINGDEIVIDSISSTSTAFESVELTDCTVGWADKVVLVTISFKSINDVQLKVGDTISFNITLKSKNGKFKKTTLKDLSLTMIDAPCELVGESFKDGLTGVAYCSRGFIDIEGFEISNSEYSGTMTSLLSETYFSDDYWDPVYKLIFRSGTPIHTKATANKSADATIETGFSTTGEERPELWPDHTSFVIPFSTDIQVLFTPDDTQIVPYISSLFIDENVTLSVEVKEIR